MAYSDSTGNNRQLLRRTICGTTDFTGRSRRTEVVYYWITSALVGIVVSFAVGTISSFETSVLFVIFLRFLLLVPFFALFVRRLHDQNRSGWWGLLLPLYELLGSLLMFTKMRGNIAAILTQPPAPVSIAAELCALAVLVLCLLPGTDEANRFGPNPRLETA